MIAVADPDRFSIVTIFGARTPAPAWETMFGWPAAGRDSVPLDIRSAADRKIWAARLDQAVREADRAVLLVADGIGCMASAWWARLSPADYVSRIAGAVMIAPDQAIADGAGMFDSPHVRLPFPSLVIQPGAGASAGLHATVADWGSRLVISDRERHRPQGTGAVAWRQAQRLFLRLTEQVVEHDVGRAHRLAGRP